MKEEIEETQVRMFQLITGDVILGEVAEKEQSLIFTNPMQIFLDPMQGLGMVPYMSMFTNNKMDEVTIITDKVMQELPNFDQSFVEKYFESLGIE
jgi:hypothetical protein